MVRSSVICYESQACHNPNLNYTSLYHSSSSGAVGTELGNVRQNQLVMMNRTEIDNILFLNIGVIVSAEC